jgi:hypothetical protein
MELHPVTKLFREMSKEEFKNLKEDIQAHGLLEPIWTHKNQIIDGRHRYRACEELGIEPKFREWDGKGNLKKFVISQNLHRRHLSAKEKREAVKSLLKANPKQSNRKVGAQAGVDDKTVAKVREDMEATAEIPQLDKTEGKDGRVRAKRPRELNQGEPSQSGVSPLHIHEPEPRKKSRQEVVADHQKEWRDKCIARVNNEAKLLLGDAAKEERLLAAIGQYTDANIQLALAKIIGSDKTKEFDEAVIQLMEIGAKIVLEQP